MNKKPEITAATRARIVDAFWELYTRNRIEKITVRAIAEKAQIHRSTFYEYFTDIYALLDACETELIDFLITEYAEKYLTHPIENLTSLYPIASSILKDHIVKFYLLLGPNGDPSFPFRLQTVIRPYFIRASSLDPDDRYLDLKMTMIFNNLLSLLNYWYEHQDSFTLDEIFQYWKQFVRL